MENISGEKDSNMTNITQSYWRPRKTKLQLRTPIWKQKNDDDKIGKRDENLSKKDTPATPEEKERYEKMGEKLQAAIEKADEPKKSNILPRLKNERYN